MWFKLTCSCLLVVTMVTSAPLPTLLDTKDIIDIHGDMKVPITLKQAENEVEKLPPSKRKTIDKLAYYIFVEYMQDLMKSQASTIPVPKDGPKAYSTRAAPLSNETGIDELVSSDTRHVVPKADIGSSDVSSSKSPTTHTTQSNTSVTTFIKTTSMQTDNVEMNSTVELNTTPSIKLEPTTAGQYKDSVDLMKKAITTKSDNGNMEMTSGTPHSVDNLDVSSSITEYAATPEYDRLAETVDNVSDISMSSRISENAATAQYDSPAVDNLDVSSNITGYATTPQYDKTADTVDNLDVSSNITGYATTPQYDKTADTVDNLDVSFSISEHATTPQYDINAGTVDSVDLPSSVSGNSTIPQYDITVDTFDNVDLPSSISEHATTPQYDITADTFDNVDLPSSISGNLTTPQYDRRADTFDNLDVSSSIPWHATTPQYINPADAVLATEPYDAELKITDTKRITENWIVPEANDTVVNRTMPNDTATVTTTESIVLTTSEDLKTIVSSKISGSNKNATSNENMLESLNKEGTTLSSNVTNTSGGYNGSSITSDNFGVLGSLNETSSNKTIGSYKIKKEPVQPDIYPKSNESNPIFSNKGESINDTFTTRSDTVSIHSLHPVDKTTGIPTPKSELDWDGI